MSLYAIYFDGRSAQARSVRLLPAAGEVWLRGEDFERREPLDQVRVGERLGRAPRMLRFADGAHLEVSDHEGFARWLGQAGYRERSIDLAQRSWGIAAIAIVLVLAAGFSAYRWGLPVVAQFAAQRIPAALRVELSEKTLALMDGPLLRPSRLGAQRQAQLDARFGRLAANTGAVLLFRSAPMIGPNAMALPDGRIVLLDELVWLADNDEQILAVLAHELAHVERRHALRLMIQSAAVGAFVAWWIGDFGPLLAAAPAALMQARHSRELEAEADALAAERLRRAGMRPASLADMLEKLGAAQGAKTRGRAAQESGEDGTGWLGYLSSHPATRERIEALRREPEPRRE